MKVAVFDHQLNYGGGKRFLINLLCAIADVDKSIQISLFCNIANATVGSFDFDEFTKRRIVVKPLKSLEVSGTRKSLLERAYNYILKRVKLSGMKRRDIGEELNNEIYEISKDFDIAYFPWPYLIKSPKTVCPKVATFHDFNFKYFFGTPIYSQEQIKFLNEHFKEWMKDVTPVVSTHFMENEMRYFYPDVKSVKVVHLASLNAYNKIDLISDEFFEYKYLLDKPYIVFPVHITSHKNIGNVIAATSLINDDELRFRLVLTGRHTESIKGKSSYLGLISKDSEDIDVMGLGYIPDKQMHYLQRKAFAVLNASFYEAGNGVGLDAWPLGVPVIQSNIPSFQEHIQLQGVKAFTFDPRNAQSISKAIQECLENVDKKDHYVDVSLIASAQMTWEVVAKKYLAIFNSSFQK